MALKYIAGNDVKQYASVLLKSQSPIITVATQLPRLREPYSMESEITLPVNTRQYSIEEILEMLLDYTVNLERDMEELMHYNTQDKMDMSANMRDTSEFIEQLIDHERVVWND